MGHRWTKQEARLASEKGLATRRQKMAGNPEAYRRGYRTGWAACERFYKSIVRGKNAERMRHAQKDERSKAFGARGSRSQVSAWGSTASTDLDT